MPRPKTGEKRFVFRRYTNIGAADAIEDIKFLQQSFVDTGAMEVICDFDNPQCVIVGRTGTGKTALLEKLNLTKERVIRIAPEGLALTYVANSGTIRFFSEAGVNMDLFYQLLWRHVFAVELIRKHYNIINKNARDSFLLQMRDRLSRNQPRSEAIKYLVDCGESFWLESEHRVKEVTSTLEHNLTKSLEGEGSLAIGQIGSHLRLSALQAKSLSEQEKTEVIHRGQQVVNNVQMRKLSEVIRALENDILADKGKRYYITIDRLDENWVDDTLRYNLIRALIDTIREFNYRLTNVKILVALREDLIDRVFRYSRAPGYQEEKYRSMYLPLRWHSKDLEQVLNLRLNQIIKEQYTDREVFIKDFLPSTVDGDNPTNYILTRTLLRPRDAISFFNECIRAAEGKTKITKDMIMAAEAIYSISRLHAIEYEWETDYPGLLDLCFLLKRFPKYFKVFEIRQRIEEAMLDYLISKEREAPEHFIYKLIESKFNFNDTNGFMVDMFKILFLVGLVGVKPDSTTSVQWAHEGRKLLNGEVSETAVIHIHPAFWRVLGIRP